LLGRIGIAAYRSWQYHWMDLFLKAVKEGVFAPS